MKIRNILLGICGGISCYKSAVLTRMLMKEGYSVRVVLTPAAQQFVTPCLFQGLTGQRVYHDMFAVEASPSEIEHIALAQWAHLCVVAPCTANTIAKIVHGLCDNLLTAVICALPSKVAVLLVPAMNDQMWINPIVQDNLNRLRKFRKYHIIDPLSGDLACGTRGQGRMAEPESIVKVVHEKSANQSFSSQE